MVAPNDRMLLERANGPAFLGCAGHGLTLNRSDGVYVEHAISVHRW